MSREISVAVPERERSRLQALILDSNVSQRLVRRVEVVLLSAEGFSVSAIARKTGRSGRFSRRWLERFAESGFEGLLRNKRHWRCIVPMQIDAAKRSAALMLVGSMVEVPSWCGPVHSAMFSELARIHKLVDVSRPRVLETRSLHLDCFDGLDEKSSAELKVPRDQVNGFAAHVTLGMSKFRVSR